MIPGARVTAGAIGSVIDLRTPRTGRVHSVFTHAVNLELGEEMWTVVAPGGHDAALTVRLSGMVVPGDLGLRIRDPVYVRSRHVRAGAAVIDARTAGHNFVLVSVPGDYAAAEGMKALRLGMDVMLFSDNVAVADELALKTYARDHDLMVMGPDCGTAIVNGVPLGFANVVRRGPIGVVGASGTGTQEVTVRVHQLGSGISQALGTGGHDLSEAIGGLSMLHGFAAFDEDPATSVIVLVSKPPAAAVAAAILDAAEASAKPVVVIFLGADPSAVTRNGVHGAAYLAQAADMAVALAKGQRPREGDVAVPGGMRRRLTEAARGMAPGQQFVRGIFSGGTFCFEAPLAATLRPETGGGS